MIFDVKHAALPTLTVLLTLFLAGANSQAKPAGAANPNTIAEKAIEAAAAGRCADAIPELRKAVRNSTNGDLKKLAGLHGLRCAMIRNMPVEAEDFLQALR